MPNRYLRESLKESESVNSVGFQAQVTWVHLILTVDDWGRCEASPKVLRPKLFPLRLECVREADLSRWISECETAGLVRLYQIQGKEYLQMMRWELGRAEKSRYPAPPPEILETCYLGNSQGICGTKGKKLSPVGNNGKQSVPMGLDSDSDSDSDSGSPYSPPELRDALPTLYRIFGITQPSMRDENTMQAFWIEIRAKKATLEQVEEKANLYREQCPGYAFTPNAVLRNWHSMAAAPDFSPAQPEFRIPGAT